MLAAANFVVIVGKDFDIKVDFSNSRLKLNHPRSGVVIVTGSCRGVAREAAHVGNASMHGFEGCDMPQCEMWGVI